MPNSSYDKKAKPQKKQKRLLGDESFFDNEPESDDGGGKSFFCGLRRSAPKAAQRDPAELANQAYVHMLGWQPVRPELNEYRGQHYGGLYWQGEKQWGYSRDYQGAVDNTAANIGVPYPIDELESQFLERFRSRKFYAVHFGKTDFRRNDGDITFLSSFSLVKKGVAENMELGTGDTDKNNYGSDDFVFFSLEVGDASAKKSSRFGQYKYTAPLDTILGESYGKYAGAQLNDIMDIGRRSEKRLPGWMKSDSETMAAYRKPAAVREAEIFYTADKLIEGIGIRLLQDFREFPAPVRQQALATSSDVELDTLMNSFYRPQILVPKGLSLSKGQYEFSAQKS
jgi:hypothetical protein